MDETERAELKIGEEARVVAVAVKAAKKEKKKGQETSYRVEHYLGDESEEI